MKRRGFLGSLVTIVVGSALPVKAEEKPLIRLETIPADSPLREKMKSKFVASGTYVCGDGHYFELER
jgi:hypothetical protein